MTVTEVANSDNNIDFRPGNNSARAAERIGSFDPRLRSRDPLELAPARGLVKGLILGVGAWAAILTTAAALLGRL